MLGRKKVERRESSYNSGARGLWISVPLEKSSFIPILAKHKFNFHHAKPGRVMMNRWLPVEEGNFGKICCSKLREQTAPRYEH